MTEDTRIKLNVGGAIYETTLQTIRESEYLYNLVHGSWREGLSNTKEVFIDRDGFLFRYILLYLRTNEVDIDNQHLKSLHHEAEFYMLETLSEKIHTMIMDGRPKKIEYTLLNQSQLENLSGFNIKAGLGLVNSRRTLSPNLEIITTINCYVRKDVCPRNIRIHNLDGIARCGIGCQREMDGVKEFIFVEENLYLVSIMSK